MSKLWPRWPLLLAGLFSASSSLAAEKLTPVAPSTLAQLQVREPARVAESLANLKAQSLKLGLGTRDDFKLSSSSTDSFGQTHARFAQTYQGVPVWGAMAITHQGLSSRDIQITTEGLRKGIRLNVAPTLDAKAAVTKATQELAPKGEFGATPSSELIVYPQTRLVNRYPGKPLAKQNAADFDTEVIGYRLSYHVHTELENAKDGVKHTDFIIDAQSGEVLKKWNSLQTAAAKGLGHSQYSGDVSLDVFQNADGLFELRDFTRTGGEGIRTYDVNHAEVQKGAIPTLTLYTDEDNVWGDGQNYVIGANNTLSANGQTAAVNAHYGLLATWDFYKKIFGRNGVDGVGSPTYNRVHASNKYNNAFWSDGCFCMSYGDGSYPAAGGFKSMGVLDVTGHEMTHGVTSRSAGLIYDGESGGLNEASSDIFGTMTEFWVANGRGSTIGDTGGNWLMAEQLSDFPLRVMFRPSLDGSSADAWYPGLGNIDVHYSSGPMNRAFYFLSQGVQPLAVSTDFSSTYLPAGMRGIGNDKAAAIWYRALTVYMFPASNYMSARTSGLQAAADLFGSQSNEYRAVQNAFAAINVGYTAGTYDDRTAPTVVASVAGSAPDLQMQAQADDNVGVAHVEFYVDGALVGNVYSRPFQAPLDATSLSNGSHGLVAVAFDAAGNSAASAPASFTVANSFDQLLIDPGFELGQGWVADPPGDINFPVSSGPRSGQGFVWLNGWGETHVDRLWQDVTIPAGVTKAALTFFLNLTTEETTTTAVRDTLTLQVRDTSGTVLGTVTTWSNLNTTLGWVQQSADLTAYAGQTVRIFLEGSENASLATNFQLDDFSLRVSYAADAEVPRVKASVVFSGTRVGYLAEVADNGFVNAVEFLVDGVSLGNSVKSFMRIVNLSTLTAGAHTLVARATDADGNVGESPAVTFYVDTTATQRVLNPSFETSTNWTVATTLSGSAGILPQASFAHSGARFFIFYTNAGLARHSVRQSVAIPANSTSAIFSFWLRIYNGAFTDTLPHHTFSPKVRDSAGTELATLKVLSNVDDTNAEYVQHRFDLTAYRGQTVQLFFDVDQTAAPQIAGENTQFFLDDVNLVTSTQADLQSPTLSAAVEGSYGTVQLRATVSDNIWTSTLAFAVDGAPVTSFTDVEGTYAAAFDTKNLSNGPHQFKATATDKAGNTTERTVDFTVYNSTVQDQGAPHVTASVEGLFETYTMRAEATDDTGVTFVEFYVDGALQGRSTSAPYTLPLFTIPLAPGAHVLEAVAYDAYGHWSKATTPFTLQPVTVEFAEAQHVVPVGSSVALQANVANVVNTAVTWSVAEGRICGTVSEAGVYAAPAIRGLCHVSAASVVVPTAKAVATVRVYTGDINGDNVVDGEDMGLLAQDYGTDGSEATNLDGVGSVNDSDITLFVSQFGR
ncbi:M4 family metallopeptidase [Corallococcus sp. M34]|uniref:M4 family metallopeptidase n=1 Tax=Citreicoccus inhibens TaxID=2849499 RepID=UPI001C22A3C9|nr:M4 family metallopeptidase [Citreicoccus inhibens]MBU8898585.1 M4 family metallopeptidase [Citreicoccus inhibens]